MKKKEQSKALKFLYFNAYKLLIAVIQRCTNERDYKIQKKKFNQKHYQDIPSFLAVIKKNKKANTSGLYILLNTVIILPQVICGWKWKRESSNIRI